VSRVQLGHPVPNAFLTRESGTSTSAGGDHGIDHHKNPLRFPYVSEFSGPIISTRARTVHCRATGAGIRALVADAGICAGLYRGLLLTVLRDSPSYGAYFLVHDWQKRLWCDALGVEQNHGGAPTVVWTHAQPCAQRLCVDC
jgi:hypothetical protein